MINDMVNTTKTKRVKEEKEELLHALETKVTEGAQRLVTRDITRILEF